MAPNGPVGESGVDFDDDPGFGAGVTDPNARVQAPTPPPTPAPVPDAGNTDEPATNADNPFGDATAGGEDFFGDPGEAGEVIPIDEPDVGFEDPFGDASVGGEDFFGGESEVGQPPADDGGLTPEQLLELEAIDLEAGQAIIDNF